METPDGARTCLIVVNYGSSALLRHNPSLVPDRDTSVLIVDNPTTAEERRAVRALCDERDWGLVEMSENAGFGGGVNAGVARALDAGAEVFVVLNPDATLDEGSRSLLVEAVARDHLVLAAPTVMKPDGSVWSAGATLDLFDGRTRGPSARPTPGFELEPWLSGACFAVHRDLWDAVGGFVHEYFLYWEDVDLSWRVRRSGGALRVVPGATAVHDEGGTHTDSRTERTKSGTYYFHNVRNRLLFAALNLDETSYRRWRRHSLRVSLGILLEGGRRQFLQSAVPLVSGVRGLRDGLRLAARARRDLESRGVVEH